MQVSRYLMENEEEILRLEVKTDPEVIKRHARWAGIRPGMRVADIGCGTGKTTLHLYRLVQPGGEAVGYDGSDERIDFARNNYARDGLDFVRADICQPFPAPQTFDFIWVRFLLEYHRSRSFEIVKNLTTLLKPGGTLCLIDLDNNCMNHYSIPERLENALCRLMAELEKNSDFDSRIGRKLYSFLYDLGYADIDVNVEAHHLIFGKLKDADAFNWTLKVEVAARQSGYPFPEYPGGFTEFYEEFQRFFSDPRRFTYTPVVSCKGVRQGSCG